MICIQIILAFRRPAIHFPDVTTLEPDVDWKLVRHVPQGNTWHPSTDNLKGTDVYGTPSGPLSDQAWSVNFEGESFDAFMFATGTQISID